MHPVLCSIGPFTLFSYGAMVALGFGLATLLIYRTAPAFGIDSEQVIDIMILALVSGIFGARLLYICTNLSHYMTNPLEAIDLTKGGLVWYGGFISAVISITVYARKKCLNFWNITDLIAPYLAMAQGFGRIGCFLNGCCYGNPVPANTILAITFPGDTVSRLPAQLYSACALFLIFIILRKWQAKRRFVSEIFLGYCILYSVKRFVMESLRGDNPAVVFGLTMSQCISIAVFVVAISIFSTKVRQWQKKR